MGQQRTNQTSGRSERDFFLSPQLYWDMSKKEAEIFKYGMRIEFTSQESHNLSPKKMGISYNHY